MTVRIWVVFLAGAIVTACCEPPSPPTPVMACTQGSPPLDSTQLARCLEGVAFDTAYEVGDEQPLMVMGDPKAPPCPGGGTRTCRYGPLAKIEPVIAAQNYSDEELTKGRFIARLYIPSTETEDYPKYNLQRGAFTYWWVKTDAAGTGGESYFITAVNGRVISSRRRPLVREPYDAKSYQQDKGERQDQGYRQDEDYEKATKRGRASMRWIWTLEDETAKGQCGTASCK
jgi:hypothetical protein